MPKSPKHDLSDYNAFRKHPLDAALCVIQAMDRCDLTAQPVDDAVDRAAVSCSRYQSQRHLTALDFARHAQGGV